jgi:hypothetical protein
MERSARFRVSGVVGAAALALAGCAAQPPGPVDPRTIVAAARFDPLPRPAPGGSLRVLTPTFLSMRGDDVPRWLRQGYDVFDAAGAFVRRVENRVSFADEGVTTVSLPPGRYLLAVPGGRGARFWVEVTIEAGRLTEADVESFGEA